jgi:hypothetical protein
MEKIDNPHDLKRTFRQEFAFNKLELAAFNTYCKRYKVRNRSKFIRETLMVAILQRLESDYPTLFSEEEMRQIGD